MKKSSNLKTIQQNKIPKKIDEKQKESLLVKTSNVSIAFSSQKYFDCSFLQLLEENLLKKNSEYELLLESFYFISFFHCFPFLIEIHST